MKTCYDNWKGATTSLSLFFCPSLSSFHHLALERWKGWLKERTEDHKDRNPRLYSCILSCLFVVGKGFPLSGQPTMKDKHTTAANLTSKHERPCFYLEAAGGLLEEESTSITGVFFIFQRLEWRMDVWFLSTRPSSNDQYTSSTHPQSRLTAFTFSPWAVSWVLWWCEVKSLRACTSHSIRAQVLALWFELWWAALSRMTWKLYELLSRGDGWSLILQTTIQDDSSVINLKHQSGPVSRL